MDTNPSRCLSGKILTEELLCGEVTMFARGNLICGFTQCGGDKTHRGQEAGVSNTVVRTGCRGQNMVQKPEP